jgi:hypothetical protein
MVEGIWGNFKNQIEKFKIPTAPLLYRYAVWVVFVAATFMAAKIRRLSALRLHSSRLHAFTVFFTLHASRFTQKKSPLPLFKKERF